MTCLKAPTSLAFYRTDQTLKDFQRQRPKNLNSIYEAILDSVRSCKENLNEIELDFFHSQSPDSSYTTSSSSTTTNVNDMYIYLRKLVLHMKHLSEKTFIKNLNSTYQVDHVSTTLAGKQDDDYHISVLSMKVYREFDAKLLSFMPDRFEKTINEIEMCMEYLSKYCLSFFTDRHDRHHDDVLLETAKHYKIKQSEFLSAIKEHLSNVVKMSRDYRSASGLQSEQFGLTTNELARRLDCGNYPLILVMTQALSNLRNSLKGIEMWIESDREYAVYVKEDIIDLQEKHDDQLKLMEQSRKRFFHLDVLLKRTTKELINCRRQVDKSCLANDLLIRQLEEAYSEIRYVNMDIDIINERLYLKNGGKDGEEEEELTAERLDTLKSKKIHLLNKIPILEKKIELLKNKKYWIDEKKKMALQKEKEFENISREFIEAKSQYEENEREFKRIENCLTDLKNIFVFKTNSSSLKKIFHNMPVTNHKIFKISNNLSTHRHHVSSPASSITKNEIGKQPKANDRLDTILKLVAKLIQADWANLYANLPFFPQRGQQIIEADIDKIRKDFYRNLIECQALESLRLWRRVHSRSSLHCLKSTLNQLDKHHISQAIDAKLQKINKRQTTNRNKIST